MRLVLQAPHIQNAHLAHCHGLIGNNHQFMQTGQFSYYLPTDLETLPDDIQRFCLAQKLDVALVPDAHNLKTIKLCVMDMDSTLITIECIDEIADMLGIKPKIAAITERAMRGELDFSESLRERVSLLEGLTESDLMRVLNERLQLSPGAQAWVDACKANGVTTMLVSGGFTFFANKVKDLLGLDYAVANTLDFVDGKLTGKVLGDIVDGQRKANELIALRDKLGLNENQTMAIGDGANDLTMMGVAELGIAYKAKPVVQTQATYAINAMGLDGAVGLLSV